jgi:hypothetical protein
VIGIFSYLRSAKAVFELKGTAEPETQRQGEVMFASAWVQWRASSGRKNPSNEAVERSLWIVAKVIAA